MSDIGDDIADVLAELGSTVNVYKYGTNTTVTEFVDINYEVNHAYPVTSHYMMKCDFAYTTVASPGDLLTFTDDVVGDPTRYLLVALARERFEREIISKEGVLYMCNNIVQILEPSGERNVDFEFVPTWNNVYSGEYAYVTGLVDNNKVFTREFGEFSIDSNFMFISSAIAIKKDDRCVIKLIGSDVSGEKYQVTVVEKNTLPGIHVCKIVQDERE